MEPREEGTAEDSAQSPRQDEMLDKGAPAPRFSASRLELDALRAMLGLPQPPSSSGEDEEPDRDNLSPPDQTPSS